MERDIFQHMGVVSQQSIHQKRHKKLRQPMVNTWLTLPLTWINFELKTALPLTECEKVLSIQVCVEEKFGSVQVQT